MKKRGGLKRWHLVLIFLFCVWLIAFIINQVSGRDNVIVSNEVVVIPINGFINIDNNLFFDGSVVSSDSIINFIEQANKDNNVKGIILEINSPGSTVVAAEEIVRALDKVDKPKIAWIREVGASGGYWISAACDKIVADPLSITGSIGVTSSYLEFSGLMEKYGVGYEQLMAGDYKEVGVPYKKLEQDEREFLQNKLDIIHKIFLDDIKKKRNLNSVQMNNIASAAFYLGIEAKELGLVDELGGKEDAISSMKELTGLKNIKLVTYEKKEGLLDLLRKLTVQSSYYMGKGISTGFKSNDELKVIA